MPYFKLLYLLCFNDVQDINPQEDAPTWNGNAPIKINIYLGTDR